MVIANVWIVTTLVFNYKGKSYYMALTIATTIKMLLE